MRSVGRVKWAAGILVLFVLFTLIASTAARAVPLHMTTGGSNGRVRTTEPGLSCADDGKGSYRHYLADGAPTGGSLAGLFPASRATLDVHYDGPPALGRQGPNAFLLGTESHATLTNERGSIQLLLQAGGCQQPAISFDGTTAAGSGTWGTADISGTGAYRQVTGSGAFSFSAEMNPGADNAWSLALDGEVQVLQPSLQVEVVRTYWGQLGLDYVHRVVTVVYRLRNAGPGDSFGARFLSADPNVSGVRACGEPFNAVNACPPGPPPPQGLGDLAAPEACQQAASPPDCDVELVSVRYFMDPLGPCELLMLSCTFPVDVTALLPDALDVATPDTGQVATVAVTTPALPPPL